MTFTDNLQFVVSTTCSSARIDAGDRCSLGLGAWGLGEMMFVRPQSTRECFIFAAIDGAWQDKGDVALQHRKLQGAFELINPRVKRAKQFRIGLSFSRRLGRPRSGIEHAAKHSPPQLMESRSSNTKCGKRVRNGHGSRQTGEQDLRASLRLARPVQLV